MAVSCRNAVLCWICRRVGHRSFRCREMQNGNLSMNKSKKSKDLPLKVASGPFVDVPWFANFDRNVEFLMGV